MFKNYLLIATRTLSKNLGYTSINVFGLAIGLACCLLVTLYIRFETSFENFHENKASLYRYVSRYERDGQMRMQTNLPPGMAPLLANHFPEVEHYTRFGEVDERPLMVFEKQPLDAKRFVMADAGFFQMFTFPIVQGDAKTVLTRPFTIAIAQSVADKYFPGGDALGKTIRFDNEFDFEVSGVFEDVPANSHLQFTYVSSFITMGKVLEKRYNWPAERLLENLDAWNYSAYFYIPNAADPDELAKRMDQKFTEARGDKYNANVTGDWLQPLEEIHFTKGIRNDVASGDKSTIYIFSAVALLILIIACFNFMNLSTARAMKRAKEVGLRKVMGAFRHQLVRQFLGETLIMVSIALVLGIVLLELMVPMFNSLVGQQLKVEYFTRNSFIWIFILAGLVTGVLAGSYPAFYLSSFNPARVLKGETGRSGNAALRKVLTVMQFGVAIFLLIGTFAVFKQMSYVQDTNLGFNQESIIYFAPPTELYNRKEAFRQNLLQHSAIQSATFSNGTPGMSNSTWGYNFPDLKIEGQTMNTMIIDFDYLKTYGLEIVEGRNISSEFSTDSSDAYLINETAVRDLMLENPIGTTIQVTDGHGPGKIVGVVKDFHYRSLHKKIEPLVLRHDQNNMWCMSVKFSDGALKEGLAAVESEWKKIVPDYPFNYEFVDDTIARQYKADQNTGVLLTSFSALAIIIACLGLLGLTAFMTEQRKKEIGVRKVLGASVASVVLLLSKDFSKLIIIAFVIVVPIAWYAVNQWLNDFAYKAEISPLVYLGAGLSILIVAFSSMAYQSIKAAVVNPSDTLRNE
ncbi:MAG: ABC transporter permease [Cyclobacteriaceae bacterium]|nr:ABC transporter permease [Cyclobacteriaceae bacterium]